MSWGNNVVSWVHIGDDKEGGGILTMWENQQFRCYKSVDDKGFILITGALFMGALFMGVVSGVIVAIMNIYAPCFSS